MANEATLIYDLEPAIPFTTANANALEKGSLVNLTDLMTCSGARTANEMIAGITKTEKIANDGKTRVSVFRKGIFKVYASGAINVGQACSSASSTDFPNYVKQAGVTVSGAAIIGHALETAAAGETFFMELNVGCGGNQIS